MERIKTFLITWQKPLLVLSGVLVFSLYEVINYHHLSQKTLGTSLNTWIDEALPIWPHWQYVYVSVYAFALFPAFFIRDNLLFRRTFCAFLLVQLTSFLFFIFSPTAIERPGMGGRDFVSWGIQLNQLLDPPYNCFPSLHVGNSYILAFGTLAADRRMGMLSVLWATLIALSTLFVRHHFFLDVVGGLALAVIFYFILVYPVQKRERAEKELHRSRWWILAPVVITGAGILLAYLFYLNGYNF